MNRRELLKAGWPGRWRRRSAATSSMARNRKLRVGLIGTGLVRQVGPVPFDPGRTGRVVSLCDVDKKLLAEAVRYGRHAPGLEEENPAPTRLSRDAQGKGPDIVA